MNIKSSYLIKSSDLINYKSVKWLKIVNRAIEKRTEDGSKELNFAEMMSFANLCSTQELVEEITNLKSELNMVRMELNMVSMELDRVNQDREKKAALKEARAKRKRLAKRQPITSKIYKLIIDSINKKNYLSARLRVAFCLLAVTGVRVNELLPLKMYQLQTLRKLHWIAINRSKRGPASHKAFLTPEGKRIVRERYQDFEILSNLKEPDSYIFSPESDHNRMLRRESLTRDINKVMRKVSLQLPGNPNLTSHSFRAGYITQLWKDTKDIEFVRQAIGHVNVESTSSYVKSLSDKERQERMRNLQ